MMDKADWFPMPASTHNICPSSRGGGLCSFMSQSASVVVAHRHECDNGIVPHESNPDFRIRQRIPISVFVLTTASDISVNAVQILATTWKSVLDTVSAGKLS